jgi:dihydroneopterin aldolase
MSIVSVHQLRSFAYHGCMEEEAKIGTHFFTDVDVWFDFSEGAKHDDLSQTVDYVLIAKVVQEQMAIRSKLIENVAYRIIQGIRKHYPGAKNIRVVIHKHNAPAGADMKTVSVTLEG